MGLGDAKLAVIGFWFGWISVPFVIFISSIVALISVIPSLINKSKKFSYLKFHLVHLLLLVVFFT